MATHYPATHPLSGERRIDIDAVNLFLVQVAQELESMEVLTVDNRVKRSRARRPLKSSSGLQCGESRLAKLPNYNKILRMSIRFLAARIAEICCAGIGGYHRELRTLLAGVPEHDRVSRLWRNAVEADGFRQVALEHQAEPQLPSQSIDRRGELRPEPVVLDLPKKLINLSHAAVLSPPRSIARVTLPGTTHSPHARPDNSSGRRWIERCCRSWPAGSQRVQPSHPREASQLLWIDLKQQQVVEGPADRGAPPQVPQPAHPVRSPRTVP